MDNFRKCFKSRAQFQSILRTDDMHHSLSRRCVILAVIMLILLCMVIYGVLGAPHRPPSSYINSHLNNSDKELKLVHLLFRHGERTPADTYPNDPYLNETYYPYGWGHLTNNGKLTLYEMGQWLRQRYGSFLGNHYTPDSVHAQSTGVTRTRMSNALVLAGLFPPKHTVNEWNSRLNWQPIPTISEPLDQDTLLLVRTSCPRYHEALEQVFEIPEVKQYLEENQQLFDELSLITGMEIKTPDDVQSLYSTLKAEDGFGLKLPEWTHQYYPDKLLPMTERSFVFNVYTEELKRLKGGPFIKKLVNEWNDYKSGTLSPKDRKIYVYTGHDSSISNVLSALNVWDEQVPTYGIMAMFEFYKDKQTGHFGVEMYLKNTTGKADPYPLTIPGCSHFCPLHDLEKLVANVLPKDMKTECSAFNQDFTEPSLSGP